MSPKQVNGAGGGVYRVIPDPDFEDFARDCIRLARQEKSPELRSRLLVLAREWMHAAMREAPNGAVRMVATSEELWSREDLEDLKYSLKAGTTYEEAAASLCRSAEEVSLKAHELGFAQSAAVGSIRPSNR
jgi:hypothetical protein